MINVIVLMEHMMMVLEIVKIVILHALHVTVNGMTTVLDVLALEKK